MKVQPGTGVSITANSAQQTATKEGVPAAPQTWGQVMLAPGWPISPIRHPHEERIPREIDYPISANATIQPRSAYGLMDFGALSEAFSNITEVSTAVHTITRECNGFIPQLVDNDGSPLTEHPYLWLTESPDRNTPWSVWYTRFLQSKEVFDAAAFYIQQSDGELKGLRYVDGSTLLLLIDEYGNMPKAEPILDEFGQVMTNSDGQPLIPPAFAQIIKGTSFNWYTQNEIWYRPTFRRYNAPYGMSPIEMAWGWILILANITGFELSHYREGNSPEGFFNTPKEWSLNQIDAYEMTFNGRMQSGLAERNRARFLPNDVKWTATKKPDFPDKLYVQAHDNLLFAFGIPPSEYGKMPGQGLGGKGFSDVMQQQVFREMILPRNSFTVGAFNEILDRFGVDDARFKLGLPTESIDPEKEKAGVVEQVSNGVMTINEGRAKLGLDDVEGGDVLIVVKAGQVTILSDILKGKIAPEPGEADPQAQPSTETDKKLTENILQSGSLSTKTYSLPAPSSNSTPSDVASAYETSLRQSRSGITETQPSTGGVPSIYRHLYQKSAAEQTGVMVALYMPDPVAMRLADGGAAWPEGSEVLPASEMHITLAFLGDSGDLPFTKEVLVRTVQQFAAGFAKGDSINGKINGIGRFLETHKPGMNAVYANFDAPALASIRQSLVSWLESHGITIERNHGFTPHITLAYIPEGAAMPQLDIQVMQASIPEICVSWASETDRIQFGAPMPLIKAELELMKHCGVCEEDDAYYGAPIARDYTFEFPLEHHANEIEIVAMCPPELPPKPALWKPEGGENEALVNRMGGPQFVREEAAYLLDRSLDFRLVPVAYVTEANGEVGVAIYYTMDAGNAREPDAYDPAWYIRAGVLDYVMGQVDRHGGNWLTHPDDPDRLVFIDNGLSFSTDPDYLWGSPFIPLVTGKQLPQDVLDACKMSKGDAATWRDIADLCGKAAATNALARLMRVCNLGMVPRPGDFTEDQ